MAYEIQNHNHSNESSTEGHPAAALSRQAWENPLDKHHLPVSTSSPEHPHPVLPQLTIEDSKASGVWTGGWVVNPDGTVELVRTQT